ncbi:hypothetical protein DFP72DRAFT_1167978 [Ephemerocybe angulata]|uniref:Uncharacterized protein n=1 Tax=Ephemerocybe angulata TaxID=980116 RepID=A0A8H6I2T8_9AGAR|nr:hypothetical protein DFP72DRAFT_1167978 [Tulosesus angulatus]
MQPHFPPELLDLIIDEAEDSLPTLHSLSWYRSNALFEQGGTYSSILISDIIRRPMERRLRNLRKLFGKNKTLASCVKSINVRMGLYDETVFIENLPPILQCLTSLSSVQITGFASEGGLHWKRIPKQAADAIAECLSQPGISEVAVEGLWDAPSQLIFSSPSLKRLYLESMWDLLPPPTDSCTALTELVVVGSSDTYIRTLAHASPSLFSHLKAFQMDPASSENWITCREILQACRGTVERIVLRVHEITADEEDILLLPHVKHLNIEVFTKSWGQRLYLRCPRFVQDARMTLSKYGTNNLEVLESLSLQISIITNTCRVAQYHSLPILQETDEWSFLDEYLSSLANNRLQVKRRVHHPA